METGVVKYAEDDLELDKKALVSNLAERVSHRLQRVIYEVYVHQEQKS